MFSQTGNSKIDIMLPVKLILIYFHWALEMRGNIISKLAITTIECSHILVI